MHRNVPGMLGRLNEVFSARGINIAAQYLQTDGEIGYVVLEPTKPVPRARLSWMTCARWRARSAPGSFTGGCS